MSSESEQEEDRIEVGKLALIALGAVIVFGLALGAAGLLLRTGDLDRPPAPEAPPQATLVDTQRGLDLKQAQRAALARYEWIDRDAGLARIPVERAMDIIAGDPSLADLASRWP